MSKGIEKTKPEHLEHDLIALFEIPQRVKELDEIRLIELIKYGDYRRVLLNRIISSKIEESDFDDDPDILDEAYSNGWNKEFNDWATNIFDADLNMNYFDLENLISVLEIELSKRQLKPQPLTNKNFQTIEDYNRFKYCRDHAKSLNRRYVSTLYGYFKNKGLFKFKSQYEFAIYWNKEDKGHTIKFNVKSVGIDAMSWDCAEHDEIERLIEKYNTVKKTI